MAVIAKYKFDQTQTTDILPAFNYEFTYSYSDVVNSDGTITRTIESDSSPTKISFFDYFSSNNPHLLEVYELDISAVFNLDRLFRGCTNLSVVEVSNFKIGNELESLDYAFADCSSLQELDLSGWNVNLVYGIDNTFSGCTSLKEVNLSGWNTSTSTAYYHSWYNCSSLETLDISGFSFENIYIMEELFTGCDSLTKIKFRNSTFVSVNNLIDFALLTCNGEGILDISGVDSIDSVNVAGAESKFWYINTEGDPKVIITQYKFNNTVYDLIPDFDNTKYSYIYTDEINGNITTRTIESSELPKKIIFGSKNGSSSETGPTSLLEVISLNTENMNDMTNMFFNCKNVTTINTEGWDTSKVTSMHGVFYDCIALEDLDVSSWDTNKVTDMKYIFYGCESLTEIKADNFITTKVTDMYGAFGYCLSLTNLNINNWDVSNVTTMNEMFIGCSALEKLDLSNWNTGNVTTMNAIFKECSSLIEINVSNWDVKKVINMSSSFQSCKLITHLDLSGWETISLINYSSMFANCSALKVLDISSFNSGNIINNTYPFMDANALQHIGLLYANKTTVNYIINDLYYEGVYTYFYVQNTKAYEYIVDEYAIVVDYKEQFITIDLPQSLNAIGNVSDRFYWDNDKGRYCIEQWISIPDNCNQELNESFILSTPNIIETNITNKINFNTYNDCIVIRAEGNVLPSNISAEIAMKEQVEEGE